MLYLVGAIIFASLFSIIFKLCQKYGIDNSHVILINYFTAIFASWVPIAFKLLTGQAEPSDYSIEGSSYIFAVIQGILFVSGFTVMDYSIWRSGVALTTVAARASLIMPVILGWLLLDQPAPKWGAVVLVIIALYLIISNNEIQKHEGVTTSDISDKQRSRRAVLLLIAVFLFYGVSDFNLKLSQNSVVSQLGAGENQGTHLDAMMGLIFLVATVFAIVPIITRDRQKRQPFGIKSIIGGLALGIVNILCTSCSLRALGILSTDIYYPIYNIGIVIVATVAGVVFFKEKIQWTQVIGIILAVAAIVLFFL